MKKRVVTSFSLILMLVLSFGLVACGKKDNEKRMTTTKKKVVK